MSSIRFLVLSICITAAIAQRPGFQFQPNAAGSGGQSGPAPSSGQSPAVASQAAPSRPQRPNSAPHSPVASTHPIPVGAGAVVVGRADFHCPERFGFYPHHKSCDKYYTCENGTSTLKVCGNGLVFDFVDSTRENCAYPFSVECGDRTDLEPPISTPNCPRLYGIFPHSSNCRTFYSCWNGEASKYECPPGLAYDADQRVCVWADLVERCDQLEVAEGFVCPENPEGDQPGHYTRHAHPTDCRKFYVCIEQVARPYGCSFGTVFNVDTLQCDEPENVPGCEKYYGEIDQKTVKKLKGHN